MILLVDVFLKCDEEVLIDESFDCIIDGSFIKFNDGVINIFDVDSCLLKRDGVDYSISFDFKKSLCICDYGSFDIVSDFTISSNSFFAKYEFNGSFYEYRLNWR